MTLLAEHYVYEWVRPDCNVVFYVGKGSGSRARNFRRNKHTNDVVSFLDKKGMAPSVRIIARFVNEDSAYEFEEERIAFWGLENLTNDLPGGRNGGGGMRGKKHRQESCAKIGDAHRGKVIPFKQREYLSHFNSGKKPKFETLEKMSKARKGKKRSPESIIKSAASLRVTLALPEVKAARSIISKEVGARADVKLKKSLKIRQTKRSSPEHWSQKLSDRDIYLIGTLLTSKKDIAKNYGISEVGVDEIRKIVEKLIGISPRKNIGNSGKKQPQEAIEKCRVARKTDWDSLTLEERKERGKRMSEGRLLAKIERLKIIFWGA